MQQIHSYEELKEILISQNRDKKDLEEIEQAYFYAKKVHEGQYRVSEEPYIVHPLVVAKILADLLVDKSTIIAALLHDVLEDTDTKPEEIRERFGDDVLNLVLGVTKLGKYQFKSKEQRQAENFRRMIIAMANDIRVIFLKLADRLHNMRTLNYMAQAKQQKIAQETLDIFAPLANRLGIGKIKAELEDLSLRYLHPDKYFEIAQLVSQKKQEREQTVQMLIESISKTLKLNGINAQIQGRAKHYYSIYNKMKRGNVAFHDLYDITAVRVIVETERECYEVLGIIHSQFKPIAGRFKDYIAMPKANMYRSLHTSVLGPRSKPLEVQIRTRQMHEVAEYGVAAHWKYKEAGCPAINNKEEDIKFSWMRKFIELDKEANNTNEFVDQVKSYFYENEVFVFTPMGDVFDLPQGATAIDFAFRIHSDVGSKTVGALINGRIAQLDTPLVNGDIVEILTSKNATPRLDWLNFAKSKAAQSKIKQWFKKNKREEYIAMGKNLLEAELTKNVFDEKMKNNELNKVAIEMNYRTSEDLLAALGYGETTVVKVINRLKKDEEIEKELKDDESFVQTRKKRKTKDDVVGLEGMLYTFAKCCSPVRGEDIVGVVTCSKGVSIHRKDCNSLYNVPQERLMKISWAENPSNKTYITSIRVDVQDKLGMLKEILTTLTECNANVSYANIKSNKAKNIGILYLGIEVDNIDRLRRVITSLQSIPEVYSVKRVSVNNCLKNNSKANKPSKTKKQTH